MKRRFLLLFTVFIIMSDCVETYNFRILNVIPNLIVQAQISDKSFIETKDYPSDGRYFYVRLSSTSDVVNVRDEPMPFATIVLSDDAGNSWIYSETPQGSGNYYLYDDTFGAEMDRKYKLDIHLTDGRIYESSWEKMVNEEVPKMGTLEFQEIVKQMYDFVAGDKKIVEKDAINIIINVPEQRNETPIYYKWEFSPMWIYIAPFASISQPGYKCWVQNEYYLNDYVLLEDKLGGYKKELFFIETTRNNRIYEKFSLLVTQYAYQEEAFNFWNELEAQMHRGGLFDEPPYNLKSNFTCINCERQPVGYFSVVREQATRWYFEKKELSYYVDNTLWADCSVPDQDPGPECFTCMAYPFGNSTNVKPEWWE